jgi:hypothetical protein
MEDLLNQLHRINIKVLKGLNPYEAIEEVSWDGLRNDLMFKYQWYFEYRHALLKVKHPKRKVILNHFRYQPETETELQRLQTSLTNRIAAKNRKITEINNKIEALKAGWTELFPLEDHVNYKRALQKIDRLACEKEDLMRQLKGVEC